MIDTTRNHIGFTLDFTTLGNLAAQDPTALTELINGINAARSGQMLPLTSKLGAANLGGDNEHADWFGLFISTVKDVAPNTPGLFYRNNTRGGKGDRVQMRLRRQPKDQAAQYAGTTGAQTAAHPGIAPNLATFTPQQIAALAAMLQGQAPAPSAPAPAPAVAPPPAIPQVPQVPVQPPPAAAAAPHPAAAPVPADILAQIGGNLPY